MIGVFTKQIQAGTTEHCNPSELDKHTQDTQAQTRAHAQHLHESTHTKLITGILSSFFSCQHAAHFLQGDK